jgi:hypothetical protein
VKKFLNMTPRNRLPGLQEPSKEASELVHLEKWWATLQKQQIKRQEDAELALFYWWNFQVNREKTPRSLPLPPHPGKKRK